MNDGDLKLEGVDQDFKSNIQNITGLLFNLQLLLMV
jgi:hypothetical protein